MKKKGTSGINDEVTNSTANKDIDSGGEVHRVLVLQGGGALGAYEAGALYHWIKKDAAASPTRKK